jgi:hypothetical protein
MTRYDSLKLIGLGTLKRYTDLEKTLEKAAYLFNFWFNIWVLMFFGLRDFFKCFTT